MRSPSEPTLEISALEEYGALRRIGLPLGVDIVVGRNQAAALRIDDPGVSGRHARLVHLERGVVLTDLGSTNGTYVNGQRVTQPSLLHDGDAISFAGVSAVFRQSSPVQRRLEGQLPTHLPAPPPAAPWALTPEPPIGQGASSGDPEPITRPDPDHEGRPAVGQSGQSFRGTVLNAIPPVVNVNPYLMLDIRTDDGETIAVRARFWLPFGVPHIGEGHHVRVVGHRTRSGFIRPDSIENETTGVRWRRRKLWALMLVLSLAAALGVAILILPSRSGTQPGQDPPESGAVPSLVGKNLEVARADLRSAGFGKVVEVPEKSRRPIFTVTRVRPAAGTRVSKDTEIRVFFSFPL
jgi:FHA domain/PASTA domain